MNFLKSAALALGMLLVAQGSVFAQATAAPVVAPVVQGPFSDLLSIGIGLVIFGAALGIGGLTKAAVESMSRQPEIAGNIQTAMIISAALIEGVTFFALIILLIK